MFCNESIYIFAKSVYMETSIASNHRKLIDLSGPVFTILSMDAGRQRIPLKRYIENLLEERAAELSSKVAALDISPSIMRFVGSALPKDGRLDEIADDRLEYLLSK